MKTKSQGITLNCSLDVSWNVLYWCSMKTITLKITGQTFEYEIKVQVLKDTSWFKPHYSARFCPKSSKQPQLLFTNRRLLFSLIVRKEEWHFI